MISVLPKFDSGRAILVFRNLFPHISVVDRLLEASHRADSAGNVLEGDLVLVPRQDREVEVTSWLLRSQPDDSEGHCTLWIYCSSDEEPVAAASFSFEIRGGNLVAFE